MVFNVAIEWLLCGYEHSREVQELVLSVNECLMRDRADVVDAGSG